MKRGAWTKRENTEMIKVTIATVHKAKEIWLDMGCKDYIDRLHPNVQAQIVLYKDEERLKKAIDEDKHPILLDPKGKMLDSPGLASLLEKEMERRGSSLFFAIGGPIGFTPEEKKDRLLISLSPLTFTHQMARLLLLEQVYRAFEIMRGSPYHK